MNTSNGKPLVLQRMAFLPLSCLRLECCRLNWLLRMAPLFWHGQYFCTKVRGSRKSVALCLERQLALSGSPSIRPTNSVLDSRGSTSTPAGDPAGFVISVLERVPLFFSAVMGLGSLDLYSFSSDATRYRMWVAAIIIAAVTVFPDVPSWPTRSASWLLAGGNFDRDVAHLRRQSHGSSHADSPRSQGTECLGVCFRSFVTLQRGRCRMSKAQDGDGSTQASPSFYCCRQPLGRQDCCCIAPLPQISIAK